MCNELLQGIKSLKLYSWEQIFCEAVEKVRHRQLKLLFKGSCIAAITSKACIHSVLLGRVVQQDFWGLYESDGGPALLKKLSILTWVEN